MMVTGAACGWPLVRVRRQPDHVLESATALPFPWPGGGPVLGALEAPVVMVGIDVVEVERRLRAGELCCPRRRAGAVGTRPPAVGPRCRRSAPAPRPV